MLVDGANARIEFFPLCRRESTRVADRSGAVIRARFRRVSLGTPVSDAAASAEQARWFAEEVSPHEPQLRAFLHRQFPTLRDTDDLVQETYIKVLKARRRLPIGSVKAYLFGVARNVAITIFRRKRTTCEIAVGDFRHMAAMRDEMDVFAAVCVRQELSLLVDTMDALPERCREILLLWTLESRSQTEIAAQLGISEHTVRAQLAKGVKRCMRLLRERGVVEETR
jgi:RNA polymerase sigma factor (sigma-70 family)